MTARQPAGPADPWRREWRALFPVDVLRTLSVHRRGPRDPAFRVDQAGAVWRTSLTPDGPATIRITASGSAAGPGSVVNAVAWGPGAGWLLGQLPAMLGADDRPEDFVAVHPVLRELARRHSGTRVGRSGRVLEALIPAVLEQKVVGLEAHRAWRLLLARFGLAAPGPAPAGMRVSPSARDWARIPSWEWHRAGVEAVRARTIAGAAAVAARLEEITQLAAAQADRRLRALPGVGPWTSAEVRQRACGDADAVTVGDYHLPAAVGWTLAGRIVDDAGMLRLLAPYAGHRHRATRLIELGGSRPPRRGPRLAVRDYRAF
jgi:3-methyladenine DNA glycosylase/8-oxoguanine DNA glycosylase